MEIPRPLPQPDHNDRSTNDHSIWIQKNISRDPFDYDNCYFSLLNSLGYPLTFKPFKNNATYASVYTDSEETRATMWELLGKVQKTTGYWVMRNVSEGDSFKIESLMDHGDEYYYDGTYEGKIIPREGRQTFDQETLQGCFLRAQERLPSYVATMGGAQTERNKRAEELLANGILPIEPERLGLQLIKPTIDRVLEENPELRPPQMQIRPYR